MADKRVIEQTASSEIYNDDWFLKDSVLNGTTKISAENLAKGLIDNVDASDIAYDNSESGLTATNVQDAIDETFDNAGKVDDVKVDGVSVVDENKVAQITTPDADGISYDNTTSGLEADDVQEAIDEVVTDIESVETALETKAEVDGFYDELYAGNLLSDNTETDNAPYLYRPSPSGKSCVDLSVVGGTVAWNQLVNKSVLRNSGTVGDLTLTNNNDGYINISGSISNSYIELSSALNISFVKDHKYLFNIPTAPSGINNLLTLYGTAFGNFANIKSNIRNCLVSVTERIYPRLGTETTVSLSNFKYYIGVIDLTQAFGSTIADYVYSLEQAEAGSGIAWLKSYGFLTKDYYAYQSGKLESVNVASRKVVGKNLLDVSKSESGGIDASGNLVSGNTLWRANDYIKVNPNTNFTFSTNSFITKRVYYYDSDKNFIRREEEIGSGGLVFTTPSNCRYIKWSLFEDGNVITQEKVEGLELQIELGTTATAYEPYKPKSYPLDSDLTLRGIPKLDANNNLYYDGDTYESDGSVTRKYGVVDLGTLTWEKQSDSVGDYFRSSKPNGLIIVTSGVVPNAICAIYRVVTSTRVENKEIAFSVGTSGYTFVRDTSYSTAEAFKTAMSGVYLVYELATPTSETADAYENPQLVGSTEEFIDTRDVPIPVGGERKYYTDLKAKLEELAKIPDVPSTNGTYTLKATRSASGVTYSWVSG